MSEKVSLITVALNAEKTIEKTIKSVIFQDYPNVEYIVIDGGSTDATLDIINRYKDWIDYFVSEPDHGIYDAMNKGVNYATGDIIGIINSDDWYEKDILCEVVNCFKQYDLDGLYGDLKIHRSDGAVEQLHYKPFKLFWSGMVMGHPTVFLRKDVYIKYGFFNCKYKIAADFDLICKTIYGGAKYGHINKYIANFSEGGISTIQRQICDQETGDIVKNRADKKLWGSCLKEQIQDSRAYIFGAGIWGEFIANMMVGKFEISGIVDNDSRKWGKYLCGKLILSSDVLISSEDKIIIAIEKYENIVVEQLCEYGINPKRIIRLSSCKQLYTERLRLSIKECIEIF